MKSPEERIDSLERSLQTYRITMLVVLVLLVISQRERINGWLDKAENWMGGSSARASN